MKICLVNSLYKPYVRGGAEDIVEILAEYLSAEGHSVFVITTDPKSYKHPNILKERQGKITVFRLGGYNLRSYYNLGEIGPFLRVFWHLNDIFAFRSKALFRDIINEIQPDLIWMHNIKGIGFSITRVAKKFQATVWMTLHDVQYFDPSGLLIYKKKLNLFYWLARCKYKYLVNLILAMPDLLISPSQWLIDFYKAKGLFRKAKSIHLLNPIAGLKQTEDKSKHNGFKIVFAGQVEKHKGIETLMQAVAQFNKKAGQLVELDIWGKGSLLAKLNSTKHINFKGWVEFSQLVGVLKSYDLLIVPSLCYENSPTIIRVAKLAGIPVLGSDLGGIPELLDVNNGDYLFTPGNVGSLVKELERFQNRKLSQRLRFSKKTNPMTVKDYWEILSAKL